ncbi:MAG TPA: quinone-dependent dihydroorotate dehydrogenase, partial [Bacteroidales bacterium]|nr:quinone-dependent dihydroorotate dehydrogenase [Bacteroidales bacterium]
LERNVCGLKFKNPVGLAAGFDKNATFYNEFSAFGFSHIEIGTVTPKGQPGNPKPRSFRIPKDKGLINRMGFNNKGLHTCIHQLSNKPHDLIIGGNIGKNTATPNEKAIEDYVQTFYGLYEHVDYFVVNLSCPNIKDLRELQNQDSTVAILAELDSIRNEKSVRKPIFLKISPDLSNEQLDGVLETVKLTHIDGIVATNTTTSRNNLSTSMEKVDAIGNGGLSGAPLKERATEIIRYLAEKSEGKLPIIGIGGIMSAEDAIEKLNAGAVLIQLYSGFIYEGPALVKRINKALLKQ